jgi:photosystem II stability/assembly factor-like uncharacterized protein
MDTLYVGTRKGLFILRDAEVARVSFLGAGVAAVLPRNGTVYAAVGHGHFGAKLHRSRDAGETWEEVAAPRWPEKPADLDDRSPTSGAPVPWSLDQIGVLEADPRAADALWCGTIPGGLFHSADGGNSWRLLRSLWDRPERRQWFGGGTIFPASIPSASTLAIPVDCWRVFPVAAHDRPRTGGIVVGRLARNDRRVHAARAG